MSRARANGEGSIYPYRNGYAVYAWVVRPDGRRARKYVYGKTRKVVHEKWINSNNERRRIPLQQVSQRWLSTWIAGFAKW